MRYLALLLVILLVAGCAGPSSGGSKVAGDGPGVTSGAPPPASTAAATDETGAISGIVMDEEQRPLERVNVVIVQTLAETTTDAEGKFTFNDLSPGEYSLLFQRLGFEEVGRRATVVAGEVADLRAVMRAQEVSIPHYESLVKRAHIKNSYVFLTTFGSAANGTGVLSSLCEPCIFHLPYGDNLVEAKGEAHWTSSGNAAINDEIFLQYYVNYQPSSDGTAATTGYVKNRGALAITSGGIEAMAKHNSTRMRVNGGFYSISLDHKPEVWTTFAYVEPLPEKFTALPPV